MKSSIKNVRNIIRLVNGFTVFRKTGKTPEEAYLAMRNLFVATNGRSNDVVSRIIRKKKYQNINLNGVLKLHDRNELNQAVRSLNENGYYIFPAKLNDKTVDEILHFAETTKVNYLKLEEVNSGYSSDRILFNEKNPVSPRYQFTQQQIVEFPLLQQLTFDTSILSVAQEYLETRPILDLLAMWWSVPFHGKGKSEAAQMYHFDLDRIKFIKFFFYLTDVDTETGPHCYVRGSHKKLPSDLLKEGRLSDQEVESVFGKENMIEICGKKGTIMAVDTRGLHKGKELTKDKRLLFQIEFSNSMFGQYYPPVTKPKLPQDIEHVYQMYKDTYHQILK